ncbi:PilN domain-containing protein [Aquabacterium sp.]|uniref:PilN domain-containing protein n=1 Tax=Aquabacterium sp. TaxID=1872578 RepID=UPI0019C3F556|nr:PilN domain-containing protein [Aquabacterium sp.]MBC7701679.1 PilN domain-containing protein [Aquabacterium sp.]
MAQQINLHRPILLKPKLMFSATAIVQAAAIFTIAVVLACVWASAQVKAFQRDSLLTEKRYTQDRDQLQTALALRPASGTDVNALQQQLKSVQDSLAQQRLSIKDMHLGKTIGGRSYSAILKLVADTVPPPVWVTDVIVSIERLEITGMTLEPDALQAWSRHLSAHPMLQGQRLAAVRVERAPWRAPAATPAASNAAAPREAWSFTLVTDRTAKEVE